MRPPSAFSRARTRIDLLTFNLVEIEPSLLVAIPDFPVRRHGLPLRFVSIMMVGR